MSTWPLAICRPAHAGPSAASGARRVTRRPHHHRPGLLGLGRRRQFGAPSCRPRRRRRSRRRRRVTCSTRTFRAPTDAWSPTPSTFTVRSARLRAARTRKTPPATRMAMPHTSAVMIRRRVLTGTTRLRTGVDPSKSGPGPRHPDPPATTVRGDASRGCPVPPGAPGRGHGAGARAGRLRVEGGPLGAGAGHGSPGRDGRRRAPATQPPAILRFKAPLVAGGALDGTTLHRQAGGVLVLGPLVNDVQFRSPLGRGGRSQVRGQARHRRCRMGR